MVHASAVEVDGKAYLFSADSGTGKLTHTKQWQNYFGKERALIINDDKPAIRKDKNGWAAYGTPFSGKTDENLNRQSYSSKGSVCWSVETRMRSRESEFGKRFRF